MENKTKQYKPKTILDFYQERSAYNKAIAAKATSGKFYPFKEFNINKFNTPKRAISKDEIMMLLTTETINATYLRQLARDVFKFSYLCAGIPFVDMANLAMENIANDRLYYVRQKTHGEVNAVICEQAMEIIEINYDRQNGEGS